MSENWQCRSLIPERINSSQVDPGITDPSPRALADGRASERAPTGLQQPPLGFAEVRKLR